MSFSARTRKGVGTVLAPTPLGGSLLQGRSLRVYAGLQAQDALNKQDEEQDGGNVANDCEEHALEVELLAVQLGLIGDPRGLEHPAEQDAGDKRDDRHEHAVSDVVEDVENLGGGAVGEWKLEVEGSVPQAHDDGAHSRAEEADGGSLAAGHVGLLHTAGNDDLENRDARREGGEGHHQEEDRAHNAADGSHGGKDLGQGDEHQAGASGAQAIGAHEDEHGGDDHDAGEEGDGGVDADDLQRVLGKVVFLAHVGAVGDHDAHGQGQREERLPHGIHDGAAQAAEREALKVGDDEDGEALQAGARGAVGIGRGKREREDGDADGKHDQNGHEDLARALDALLHARRDDERGEGQEEQREHQRSDGRGDERGEEPVGRRINARSRDEDEEILEHPAANDHVVHEDDGRNDERELAQETELGLGGLIGVEGRQARTAAKRHLARHDGVSESENQDEVDDQEQAAAVLCRDGGETPQVSQTHCAASGCQNEAQLAGKRRFCMSCHTVAFQSLPIDWEA